MGHPPEIRIFPAYCRFCTLPKESQNLLSQHLIHSRLFQSVCAVTWLLPSFLRSSPPCLCRERQPIPDSEEFTVLTFDLLQPTHHLCLSPEPLHFIACSIHVDVSVLLKAQAAQTHPLFPISLVRFRSDPLRPSPRSPISSLLPRSWLVQIVFRPALRH